MPFSTEYYKSVPKDIKKNLEYRRDLDLEAQRNPELVRQLHVAFSRDVLFYINTVCWTYANDMFPDAPDQPFITYPFQDELIQVLCESIEGRFCVAVKKSRYMGATWCATTILKQRAMYMRNQEFLLGSRTEREVDVIGERNTLFGKIRYLQDNEPSWMRQPMESNLLKLTFPGTGSIIKGESSNPNFGRSDRGQVACLDEFNFWKDAPSVKATIPFTSTCVWYISSLRGLNTEMYKTFSTADGKHVVAREYLWTSHPLWSRGSYMGTDGKMTSPYREAMRARLGNDNRLAEEVDGDVQAASSQFYDETTLRHYELNVCKPPLYTGDIIFDEEGNFEDFIERPDGCWRIWIPLERDSATGRFQRFPKAFFYSAADTSSGTGASNSTISIGRVRMGEDKAIIREKVAAFASSRHLPSQLAKVVKASCQFFGDCEVKPETNGPGRIMIGELWDILKWRRVWRQVKERTISKDETNQLGWNPSGNRLALHTDYNFALYERRFINPDMASIVESRQFVYTDTQDEVIHSSEINIDDPSGARKAHGDRVVPDALLWSELRHMKPFVVEPEKKPPHNSWGDFLIKELNSRYPRGPKGRRAKAEYNRELAFIESFKPERPQ